tara:strand:+ start:2723 stop:3178 length:456 start_codon:yes stop_codon:yes gene_type:complete
MANADKDILITPNRGESADPKIEFSGATAGSSSTITMSPNPRSVGDGVLELTKADGNTIVSFAEQQTGSLFSVNDDLGNTKFEVNETGVIDARLSSGALGLPVGATSERPDTPESGYTRWNSTNNAMEIYTGNDWVEVITDYFPTGSTNFS